MYNKRYLRIKSIHKTHDNLRKKNEGLLVDQLALLRLGSTSPSEIKLEVNSIEAIKNSSNKLAMKNCFLKYGVKSPEFWTIPQFIDEVISKGEHPYPVLAKLIYGSRGRGMVFLENLKELLKFLKKDKKGYYFEKFYNFTKEYRLHVTEDGCFYTCRKMLKSDTPKNLRWFRNNNNCVWYVEENEKFDKPNTWPQIVENCVKALKSTKLDVGACDVRVNKQGNFQIIEINSAPSFGERTEQEYRKVIPQILQKKVLN
jgi:glutathione synthase/RimK-type ligase-like ATP-grasp enzyme